jgi:hypothetical protein
MDVSSGCHGRPSFQGSEPARNQMRQTSVRKRCLVCDVELCTADGTFFVATVYFRQIGRGSAAAARRVSNSPCEGLKRQTGSIAFASPVS